MDQQIGELLSPPPYYGEDELLLMVQSPTSVYTYWEITWPLMNRIADFLHTPFEHLPKRLRIYDVTDLWFDGHNAHWYREIDLEPQADHCFIGDLLADRTYVADLGICWQGRFIPLLRSRAKATPPNQPAGEYCPLIPVVAERRQRSKPQWFENFSTYTVY